MLTVLGGFSSSGESMARNMSSLPLPIRHIIVQQHLVTKMHGDYNSYIY